MVRIGVIGCGDIAITAHFPAMARCPDAEIYAISTRKKERLHSLQKQYNVPFATTDYRELLALKEVDAVIVATPPWVTPEITIEALEAGKDVLCEKPVAMTIDEAEKMKASAASTGRKLMVGMTYHHDPILHKMKEWVRSGRVGSPVLFRVSVYDELWDPQENPEHYNRILETLRHGSPSVHEGSHVFDWLHVVNGAQITTVSSYGFRSRPEFPDSNYDITVLDYSNGDRARVEVGWFLKKFPEFDFEAVGPLGIARMNSHKRIAQLETAQETEQYQDPRGWWEHCFDLQTERFLRLIQDGGECSPNMDDAIYTMRATDAVRCSMKTAAPVHLEGTSDGKDESL